MDFKIVNVQTDDNNLSIKVILTNGQYQGTIIDFENILFDPEVVNEEVQGLNVTYDLTVKSEKEDFNETQQNELSSIGDIIIKRVISQMFDYAIKSLEKDK